MQSVWYFFLTLTKFRISQQIFKKVLSIKLQGNLSSGSCTDTFRQLDYVNMPTSKKILWPLYFRHYNSMCLQSLAKQTWDRKTEEVNYCFLKIAFPRTYSYLRETIIQLQSPAESDNEELQKFLKLLPTMVSKYLISPSHWLTNICRKFWSAFKLFNYTWFCSFICNMSAAFLPIYLVFDYNQHCKSQGVKLGNFGCYLTEPQQQIHMGIFSLRQV